MILASMLLGQDYSNLPTAELYGQSIATLLFVPAYIMLGLGGLHLVIGLLFGRKLKLKRRKHTTEGETAAGHYEMHHARDQHVEEGNKPLAKK